MSSRSLPDTLLTFSFLLVLQASIAFSQDGGGIPAGAAAPTSAAGQNAAGASGGNGGSFNLSTGSTIAIAVVVSIVVVLGIASTILWYVAKKRQWRVRDTIRSSVRRVGSAITSPLTPRTPRGGSKMQFPPPQQRKPIKISTSPKDKNKVVKLSDPVPNSLKGRINNQSVDMSERSQGHKYSQSQHSQHSQHQNPPRTFAYSGDEEKDLARPAVTRLNIPQSSFDMDSPGSGQLTVWSKIFGRK